jgi:ribonuclease-3
LAAEPVGMSQPERLILEKAAAWLKARLDYEFANDDLLLQALTHRSAPGSNNERLEFLGDSVLQLVMSELAFEKRPDATEGRLSRIRSSLVKDKTLSEIAMELDIGEHLLLGAGERKTGGHRRASILADALEAIFGAIYLDAGFEAARAVIMRAYGDRVRKLPEKAERRDPKSRLQEYLQGRQLALPEYRMERVTGKAHKQSFEVSCSVAEPQGRTFGKGTTRRDAEQQAAAALLDMIEGRDGQ